MALTHLSVSHSITSPQNHALLTLLHFCAHCPPGSQDSQAWHCGQLCPPWEQRARLLLAQPRSAETLQGWSRRRLLHLLAL